MIGTAFALTLAGAGVYFALRLRSQVRTPSKPLTRISGSGDFGWEAVGESKYQKALLALAGAGEVRKECVAVLAYEDDNPYDKKAVMVMISGKIVGYLPRDDARAFRKMMKDSTATEFECLALIAGGGRGRSLGVWLDLP